eukprot:TRINITY_DN37780_c0_g1_i1.p1 TRINITY_DN37780_c0_g1~~TRINITY_DN37780_c0_g1_i1.p1  ORF type:complete len:378 (+),score=106.12 TRINITY_DN37780_c0_g1_i1:63-1136(+)
MVVPGVSERLAHCREELSECHPDQSCEHYLATLRAAAAADKHQLDFDELRERLKAQKFRFVQAQEQLNFATSQESERRDTEPPSLTEQRKTAKEDNKAVKEQIKREEHKHAQLLEEVEKVYQHNKKLYEKGLQDLQDATEAATFDGETSINFPEDAHGHRVAASEAQKALEDAMRLQEEAGARERRRRELEEELLKLEEQAKLEQRRARAYRKQEAREEKAKQSLEVLLAAEATLGFPRYDFDDARNVVVVSPPEGMNFASTPRAANAVRDVSETIRTVGVSYDEHGCLAQAIAHPILDLEREANLAVEQDDLGRLLTAVWARICGEAEKAEAGAAPAAAAAAQPQVAGTRGRRGGA